MKRHENSSNWLWAVNTGTPSPLLWCGELLNWIYFINCVLCDFVVTACSLRQIHFPVLVSDKRLTEHFIHIQLCLCLLAGCTHISLFLFFRHLEGSKLDCEAQLWGFPCPGQAPTPLHIWQTLLSAAGAASSWESDGPVGGKNWTHPGLWANTKPSSHFNLCSILHYYFLALLKAHMWSTWLIPW